MSKKIPDGAKVIRAKIVDLIHVLKQLDKHRLRALVDKAKSVMLEKSSQFADGDIALGWLQDRGERTLVDPQKLFKLTQSQTHKALTKAEFFRCVSVRTEELEKLLSKEQIDACRVPELAGDAPPSAGKALYTEFLPGVNAELVLDQAEESLQFAAVGQKRPTIPGTGAAA